MPTPAPSPVANAIALLEGDERLDRLAAVADRVAGGLARGTAGGILRGDWLGHALHPLLTDLTLGCWTGAGLLDVVGGRWSRHASRRLVGLGLLSAAPTIASGLAEFPTIDGAPERRVAAVHAAGNVVVGSCYLASWRARRREHHLRGIAWGLVGGGLACATGYLGGHLSFARGVGQGARGTATNARTTALTDDAILDIEEAAAMLDVQPEQVQVMIAEGLVTPVSHDGAGAHLRASDVLAARLAGA